MLKDRRGFMAGPFKSPRLTRAAFSTVLGTYCIDPQAKAQAGQAAVYVINGFKCASTKSAGFQIIIVLLIHCGDLLGATWVPLLCQRCVACCLYCSCFVGAAACLCACPKG